ncbi:MAG: hypothetical protein JRH19_28320, partial [Deltaproteobacteria bacterium]|nr:hypothetical protein [Deltaproteobacteria bacterium]
MRGTIGAFACASALLLTTAAQAQTYTILEGTLTPSGRGRSAPLTGYFDGSLFESDPPGDSEAHTILVDDFAFRAGDRSYGPRQPIEYDGLTPVLFAEIANHIRVEGDTARLAHLRSGGERVGAVEDEVTFRFLEFRSGGGQALGQLPGSPLPRRLHLRGTLHEVDQRFQILNDDCSFPTLPLPPRPPRLPDGGSVIIAGGSNVSLSLTDFEIDPGATVEFQPPRGGSVHLSRVTGNGGVGIDGALRGASSVVLLNPARIELGLVARAASQAAPAPSLEELGILAPEGAEVTFDALGALRVTSEGDLYVEGSFPE